MKPVVDSAAVAAIASAALFYELCPDGKAGKHDIADPDPRWPEDLAASILGIVPNGSVLSDSITFGYAFAFGLQAGARIGAEPLGKPNLKDLITKYAALFREAYKDAAIEAGIEAA